MFGSLGLVHDHVRRTPSRRYPDLSVVIRGGKTCAAEGWPFALLDTPKRSHFEGCTCFLPGRATDFQWYSKHLWGVAFAGTFSKP